MDGFFEENWSLPLIPRARLESLPAMDIYETDTDVIAEINLPDIDPEKIDISVENSFLKIHGDTEEKKEEKRRGYFKKEIRRGSFERMIKLPATVKEDEIDAVYEKGILKITIPKKTPTKQTSSKIKVKIKGK